MVNAELDMVDPRGCCDARGRAWPRYVNTFGRGSAPAMPYFDLDDQAASPEMVRCATGKGGSGCLLKPLGLILLFTEARIVYSERQNFPPGQVHMNPGTERTALPHAGAQRHRAAPPRTGGGSAAARRWRA